MPRTRPKLRKVWHAVAGPFVRAGEVLSGERLSRRTQAKLDGLKLSSTMGSDYASSKTIPLNRKGAETGYRTEKPPVRDLPQYFTTKETRRGKTIRRSFFPNGTLKTEKRTVSRRGQRLGEPILVEKEKKKTVKRSGR